MPNSCIVPKCKINYKSSKVKLSIFKVPNDEIVRKKWENAIFGMNKLNPRHYVCEKHFSEECIRRKFVDIEYNTYYIFIIYFIFIIIVFLLFIITCI